MKTIHEAAASGDITVVRQYLELNPALVNARDKNRRTPLHRATMNTSDDLEMVWLLLRFGADTQAKDKDGWTAADWADFFLNRDVCLILPAL